MAGKIQRELALLLTGKDVSASKSIKGVDRALTDLNSAGRKAGTNVARNIERAAVAGAVAATGAVGFAIKEAIDVESAITGIAKTVEGDISGVVEGLKTLARTTPTSFEELAGIAELGGAMGIAKEDLVEFTRQVAILSETTDVSAEDAATALGQMVNVIGLGADEFDNFAAALVDLGNKGNSTEAQILEIERRAGGAAKLAGVAKEETLGWAAAAANLGLNEELAGTALQNFFVKTTTLVAKGGGGLEDFAATAGMTAKEFKKAFKEDATGALTAFIGGLGKLTKGDRIKAIQKAFGKGSGLTRLLIGLSDSMDKNLTPSIETSTEAWGEAAAAQAEADKRFATTAAKLDKLRNNVDLAAATIGDQLLPVLADLSEDAVAWITDHQDEIAQFGKDLAKGVREAVAWLQKIDWEAVGGGLKIAADSAKLIIDAFTSAPAWLQGFLVTGFLANKFTGGAVMDVAAILLSQAIKGVLGMTAGVVNVTGGVVNSGGLPVPGGGAGVAPPVAGWSSTAGSGGGIGGLARGLPIIGTAIAGAEIGRAAGHEITTQFNAGAKDLGVDPTAVDAVTQATDSFVDLFSGNPTGAIGRIPDLISSIGALIGLSTEPPPEWTSPDRDIRTAEAADRTTDAIEEMRGAISTDLAINGTSVGGKIDAARMAGTEATAVGTAATVGAVGQAERAGRDAGLLTAASMRAAAAHIAATIRANRPIINVSPTTINNITTQQDRTGNSGGSRHRPAQ